MVKGVFTADGKYQRGTWNFRNEGRVQVMVTYFGKWIGYFSPLSSLNVYDCWKGFSMYVSVLHRTIIKEGGQWDPYASKASTFYWSQY